MRAWKGLLPLLCLLFLLSGCSVLEKLAVEAPPEDYVPVEDGFRYAKSTLRPQEQYLYDQLLAGMMAQEERIEDLYPDGDMIEAAIRAIDRDYPELFWFDGRGSIETSYLGDTPMSAAYLPTYAMDRGLREEIQVMVDHWTAACIAALPEGAGDYEKALHVYEYLIDHADYQTTDRNSIVNIMVHGQGLCGCYAKTAQYVLAELGIPSAYITGQAGGENHAWNLVWLEGNPVWMDPTWGDPVFEGGDPNQGPSYEYFAMTTEELLRSHTPDEEVPVPVCTTRDYNYFVRSGTYFPWYQPTEVQGAMERAMKDGKDRLVLQFAPEGYDQAVAALFHGGDVYRLFRQASDATGVVLDLDQSIWYSANEVTGTASVKIPY